MDIPTATNVVAAASKSINADATQETGATGAESLSTLNYTKLVNVPSEILLGSWVNFESWVMRSVVEAFGLAFNADRSRGSGTSKIGGAFHASSYTATNSVTQASNAAITEAELSSLVALLGTGYHSRPNTRIMFSKATELYLARQRSSGERLYPYLNQVRGASGGVAMKLALPGGIAYEVNDDMQALGTASRTIAGIGDFSSYAVLYGGMMRAALNHVVPSDQWEMGWYWQTDGGRIIDAAFRMLRSS